MNGICQFPGCIVDLDNSLKQVAYTNAVAATSPVSFEYDSTYNRIMKMTDGTGITSYAYYPITLTPVLGAGRLSGIDGPLGQDVVQFKQNG